MVKHSNKKYLIILAAASIFAANLFADTTYKVEKGDTLYSISRKYQLTVAELRAANNLSDKDVLKAGQKLVIPEADIGTAAALSSSKQVETKASITKTVEYTVVKGDSFWKIDEKTLKQEGISSPSSKEIIKRIALIAVLNDIEKVTEYTLYTDDNLIVPTSEILSYIESNAELNNILEMLSTECV